MFRLDDKVVAVVGAASGIGEAVLRAAASQGARVVGLDVDEDGLDRVCGSLSGAEWRRVDIRDGKAVDETLRGIRD